MGEVRSLAIRREGRKWFALVTAEVANAPVHTSAQGGARSTTLHQYSAALTRRFATIVVEDLSIANMMRSAKGTREEPGTRVAHKCGLNRSIADASWSRFISYHAYKAARAGGQLIRVKPHNTSNLCSRCDALTPSTIGEDYRCHHCGLVMDRDVNAALNFLRRGIMTPVTAAA